LEGFNGMLQLCAAILQRPTRVCCVRQGAAELQPGLGPSRRRGAAGSDSGTESDAEAGGGGGTRGPRRCASREQLAEAAAASREQLAAARTGRDGGPLPPADPPGLKQRNVSGAGRSR